MVKRLALPDKTLRQFVNYHLRKRKVILAAVEKHHAAAWIFDREEMLAEANKFRDAFTQHFETVDFFYALKCNPHPLIIKTLAEHGWAFDVSSGEELHTALIISKSPIMFSGPGKTDGELLAAAQHPDRVTVLVDSFSELARLRQVVRRVNKKIAIGVRITSAPKWRKFGIDLTELEKFIRQAVAEKNLNFRGIQFHTSWNLTPAAQIKMIERIAAMLKKLPRNFLEYIEFIDCGGGFWIERGEWLPDKVDSIAKVPTHYYAPAQPIAFFAQKIAAAFTNKIFPLFTKKPRLSLEPGRFVANGALHLLLTVIDKKKSRLVITDTGTNVRGLEGMLSTYSPIINLSLPRCREQFCEIFGSLCTPHDRWGNSFFGDDIAIGDRLLIPEQGAYSYALRQQFIKPLLPTFEIR